MKDILISRKIMVNLLEEIRDKFPKKSFGYFLANENEDFPSSYVLFEKDVRNDWKDLFEKYGNYYIRNDDAGFLATPEETYKVEKYIRKNHLKKVGVFHTHQRHPAIFSTVDVDLHPDDSLWHMILALKNIDYPQIKVFKISDKTVREVPINIL